MDVLLISKLYHCFKYIKAHVTHLVTALNIKFIKVFLSLFCKILFVIENCDKKWTNYLITESYLNARPFSLSQYIY